MKRLFGIIRRVSLTLIVAALGFAVGVFGVYVHLLRSGPPLALWHTETLSAEFTGENAQRTQSFDDYLRLEETLFTQLDEQIYARSESGPTNALMRYSAGSAADPRGRPADANRSFELPVDTPVGGVLLLHGMSDSPYTLRALGETLGRHGYWVLGLRLPGHGTVPSGYRNTTWGEMAHAVRLAMAHLSAKVGPESVHMVGYSTGAPLALEFSLAALAGNAAPTPASLVLISPAIGVTPAAVLTKWLGRLAVLPGLEKLAWTAIAPEFDPYKYNSFTANAAEQVHRLTRFVAGAVQQRAISGPIEGFPPTLIFLSAVDATVSTNAVVDNLLEHLAPGHHELVLFDINRTSVKESVLVADPGPLTARLMGDGSLPFALSLVANENPESRAVVVHRKKSLSTQASTQALGLSWPPGVISLSHIALPFSPDDPIYGERAPEHSDRVFLGQMAIRGERGLLRLSSDWLLRLRHNPFYDFLEARTLQWMDTASGRPGNDGGG